MRTVTSGWRSAPSGQHTSRPARRAQQPALLGGRAQLADVLERRRGLRLRPAAHRRDDPSCSGGAPAIGAHRTAGARQPPRAGQVRCAGPDGPIPCLPLPRRSLPRPNLPNPRVRSPAHRSRSSVPSCRRSTTTSPARATSGRPGCCRTSPSTPSGSRRSPPGNLGPPHVLPVVSGDIGLCARPPGARHPRRCPGVSSRRSRSTPPSTLRRWASLWPVLVDIDPASFNLSPDACSLMPSSARPSRALAPATHTFGNPCDTDAIRSVADRTGCRVVHDAADAYGSRRDGVPAVCRRCGGLQPVGTKLVTSAEGGLVATPHSRSTSPSDSPTSVGTASSTTTTRADARALSPTGRSPSSTARWGVDARDGGGGGRPAPGHPPPVPGRAG